MTTCKLSKLRSAGKHFTCRLAACVCKAGILTMLKPCVASAVVFFHTGDPLHNTTPPEDPAARLAWDLQGRWGTCAQGTPVAPHWFLTSKHLGGTIGDIFLLGQKAYVTVVQLSDPESDLALWGVSEPFPHHAQMYPRRGEIDQRMLVFGRGLARGEAFTLETTLKGWRWGKGGSAMRWGENVVSEIADEPELIELGLGELIGAEFNQSGLKNEAGLSPCDSGGGIFLMDGDEWKLAAVSYAAGGEYSIDGEGDSFLAMLFDEGGLHRLQESELTGEPEWKFIHDEPEDQPSSIWGTRLIFRHDWIHQTLETWPHPTDSIRLESAKQASGPFKEETEWTLGIDPLAIEVTAPSETRFYRVQATSALTLLSPRKEEQKLILPITSLKVEKASN